MVVDARMYPGGHTIVVDVEVEVDVDEVEEVVDVVGEYTKYAVSIMLLFICKFAWGEFPV